MADLERLGESIEFGEALLGILWRSGWALSKMPALGGEETIYEITHPTVFLSIRRQGKTLDEVAVELFKEAARRRAIAA